MPGNKTHMMIGMGIGILILYLTKINILKGIISVLLLFLYSNLADVDQHVSKIRKLIFVIIAGFIAVIAFTKYYVLIPIPCLAIIVILFSKHRKFFHTPFAALLLSLPTLFISWQTSLACYLAYLSHIFIDKTWSKTKRVIQE